MYTGGGQRGIPGAPTVSKIIFNKHDKDGSGSISRSEFHDLCYSMGYYLTPAETEHAASMIDKDGSGSIAYDEFAKAWLASLWWRTDNRFSKLQLSDEEAQVLARCADYFKYFDKDRSGSLCAQEFRHTHADLVKHGLTTKSFEEAFKDLDDDGSGHITYNEYIQWLIRIGSLHLKPID